MALLSLEMLTPAVGLVTGVVLVLSLVWPLIQHIIRQIKISKALDAFPSVEKHWLYGSCRIMHVSGLNNVFLTKHIERATVKEMSRGYRVWLGPLTSALTVIHPDLIKPVLKVSDPKAWVYQDTLKPWLGDGLLISVGKKWLRSRRLITPAFHFDILKSYVSVFHEATDVFMNKLDDMIEKKESLQLFEHVSLLTLDIILQCAFSYQTDCQLPGMRHPYSCSVSDLAKAWNKRTRKLIYMVLPFTYNFTPEGRRFKQLCDKVHEEADDIIARRKELLDENGIEILSEKKKLDFLDILLTAKDEDGNGMLPIDIRAEVDTFLFEGHDTTTSGISWTLYLMAKHSNHQQEVQKEIDNLVEVLGTDRLDRSVLSRLPVLTKCLKESMRLYPPVPFIARCLNEDLTVDGVRVLAGTNVNIPIWALHHNPSVWGEDHMEYKPERFSDENVAKQDPYAFIPFSAGPRNCIGQTFALSEEKIILARLLHKYTFSLPDKPQTVAPSVRIVLRPEEEIRLNVTPRL